MLFDAIVDKYGKKEGLTIKGDTIVDWPYALPIPSAEELKALESQYVFNNEYKYQRNNEFPGVDSLIKLLWNDIDSGIDLKSGKFYLAVKSVYDKYPAPSATVSTD
jgi:hypothetical protein